MPHLHDLIDYVVVAYIVHDNRVLLIDHKKYNLWLPIGGHIELDENPEQALYREIKEECGLEVEVYGTRPSVTEQGTKALLAPSFLDIHPFNERHRHVGFIYLGRSQTDKVKLAETEHNGIRWFTRQELADPKYKIGKFIRFYAEQALDKYQNS